jgi:hypothetical protein
VRTVAITLVLVFSVGTAMLAGCASGAVTAAGRGPSGEPFSARATQACLLHLKIGAAQKINFAVGVAPIAFVRYNRKYSRLPLVGELNLLGLDHMDSADLVFFDTPDDARSGAARLFAFWVYGRGQPTGRPVVGVPGPGPRIPPTPEAAAQLHQIYGNVVVIWQYPRRHPGASSGPIRSCL